MINRRIHTLVAILFLFVLRIGAQNESSKWYFGNFAGLDFMTSPPTILSGSSMSVMGGCASVADQSGNLLFYTNGVTIWNQNHVVMANGSGLLGGGITFQTQSCLIIKKPLSASEYYVFVVPPNASTGPAGLSYSIVDMSLAAGLGSVTVLNQTIYSGPCALMITGTRHCNGRDYWIVVHERTGTNFRSFLLSPSGLSPNATISALGPNFTGVNSVVIGSMKISVSGKKLGLAVYANANNPLNLFDFDSSTGLVSGQLVLSSAFSSGNGAWISCEFSPDGSKFYGVHVTQGGPIIQWDLCSGNNAMILASQYTVGAWPTVSLSLGSVQLAPNGKIYIAEFLFASIPSIPAIGVINNPNAAGAACAYVSSGQSVSPNQSSAVLPNFVNSSFYQTPLPLALPFTYTISNSNFCQSVLFTAPPPPTNTVIGCVAHGYSVTNYSWDFGEPSSGSGNASSLFNPNHTYSSLGTYTVKLIIDYSCGAGSDTLYQQIQITQPCVSVASTSVSCASLGSATVQSQGGGGPYTYTWQPTGQTGSIANNLYPDTYTISIYDAFTASTHTITSLVQSSLSIFTGSLLASPTTSCYGAANGSASVINVTGGTGSQTYLWSNGTNTLSGSSVNALSAGNWNVLVTDNVTFCQFNLQFNIAQPPAISLSIQPHTSTLCVGDSVNIIGIGSGGTGTLNYQWITGPNSASWNPTSQNPGTYIYTLQATDANNCQVSTTSILNFVSAPNLSVSLSSATLCSQAFNGSPNTITLTAGGATTYSLVTVPDMLNANPNGPVSPLTSIPPYTGLGSATLSGSNGVCTATTSLTFSILPNPTISVNNYTPIICAGENFTYTNQGANTYTWTSATPNFTSFSNGGVAVAHPSINSVFSVFGGSLGCNSALQTTTITVNPLPTVQITPDPLRLCLKDTMPMFAQSNGSSFQWMPPYGLTSYTSQQVSTFINQNQQYTVVATLNNCSNTAVAQVSVLPLPSPQIVPVKDEVCLNETIHLKGEGGMYYVWTAPNLQTYTIQNLQLGISHMALAGTYTLKVVDANACFNYSTHPVVVHDLPNGYLKPERNEFCVPYCNAFTFVPNTQSQITQAGPWSMNSLIYSGNSFTSCYSKAGEFSISGPIQDEFNCKNTVSITVIGRPKPIAAFYVTPENPVEGLDEVQFVNVSSNIIGYSWQSTGAVGSNQSAGAVNSWQDFKSEESSPTYVFQEAGVYGLMLMVKNEFNCWDTVMKTITVESDFAAYIPNAFTPNGDGLNDTFYPVMRGVKKFELQIFDRWGELLFSTNDPQSRWDGTFKGQECKQDVYNYKLLLFNIRREERLYTGSVTLYR